MKRSSSPATSRIHKLRRSLSIGSRWDVQPIAPSPTSSNHITMRTPINPSTSSPLSAGTKPAVGGTAPIERLPTELLEHIFWDCLNLGLPRASPVIGSALASGWVKSRLFEIAFKSLGYGLAYSYDLHRILQTPVAIARLQSSILASKWFSMDFLIAYLPLFLGANLSKQFKFLEAYLSRGCWSSPPEFFDGSSLKDLTIESTTRFVHNSIASHFHKREGKPLHFSRECRSSDGFKFQIECGPLDGTITQKFQHLRYRRICYGTEQRAMYALDRCQIPERLLHGPWTEEKCFLLEFVIQGGASVDWIRSTGGEVATEGLQDAINERSFRAVRALLEIPRQKFDSQDCINHPKCFLLRCAPAPYDIRKQIPEYLVFREDPNLYAVNVKPTLYHLMMAAYDDGCQKDIATLLFARYVNNTHTNRRKSIDRVTKKMIENEEWEPCLIKLMQESSNRYDLGEVLSLYNPYNFKSHINLVQIEPIRPYYLDHFKFADFQHD